MGQTNAYSDLNLVDLLLDINDGFLSRTIWQPRVQSLATVKLSHQMRFSFTQGSYGR